MATGYTARIAEGIDFRTFAMDCARAFGACVILRDEDGGGEKIPEEFKPSDYHKNKIDDLKGEYNKIFGLTDEQCEQNAIDEYEKEEKYRLDRISEIKSLREKYQQMLKHVEKWQPPSSEHVEMKNFMKKQILDSIVWDCPEEYYTSKIEKISGKEWKSRRISSLLGQIEYHTNENEKEIANINSKNKWIRDLRESLQEFKTP